MIRTLVTGGSGFVGSEIVRMLVANKESVRVLSRQPENVSRGRRVAGAEYVQGDLFNEESLRKAMEGCNALIVASQFDNAPFENPAKGMTYERVDGEGTEKILEIAKKSGVQRVIYISGAGVRESRSEKWFQAKWRAETAIRESGLAWTIFRPSWIYGPTDRSLNRFAMMARLSPAIFLVGSGKEKVAPVFVSDVAHAVALSLNHSKTYSKTYELGGPQNLSMCEIAKTMLRVMRKCRLVIPQPKSLMKFIARFAQYLPGRPLTPDGIDFITMEELSQNDEIRKDLSVSLTPLEQGLATYLSPKPISQDFSWRRDAA